MTLPDARAFPGAWGPCWGNYCPSRVWWPRTPVVCHVRCDNDIRPHEGTCRPANKEETTL